MKVGELRAALTNYDDDIEVYAMSYQTEDYAPAEIDDEVAALGVITGVKIVGGELK